MGGAGTYRTLNAQKFVNSRCDHEVYRELRGFGHGLRPTEPNFEIEDNSPAMIGRSSKRRQLIGADTAKRIAFGDLRENLQRFRH